jgi:methyltransferase (TIGR00027 family)
VTDRAASATALGVATLRAAHQILDAAPLILDDPVVLRLLDPSVIAGIQANPDRYRDPRVRRLLWHVVSRSRAAEDRLSEAVAGGVRQYIVLGAGFDTFAYRQPAWASALRIFEVDHPASQQAKLARLSAAGIAVPSNVEHVAIDFETTPLRDGLLRSTFDAHAPAFVSWLGVMVYLTQAASDAVFTFVATLPPPSEIVFTFSAPPEPGTPDAIAARAAEVGEPWLTRIEPDALEQRLHAHGFPAVTFLLPRVVSARLRS